MAFQQSFTFASKSQYFVKMRSWRISLLLRLDNHYAQNWWWNEKTFGISDVHLSPICSTPLKYPLDRDYIEYQRNPCKILRRSMPIAISYCTVLCREYIYYERHDSIVKNFKIICEIYTFTCAIVFYESHYFIAIYFHIYSHIPRTTC